MKTLCRKISVLMVCLVTAGLAFSAGTLTVTGSPKQPIQIKDHHVDVVINNGFARTEMVQTFHNPNGVDLEGLYAFPLPQKASLAEYRLTTGETVMDGEVVPKEEARKAYEEERDNGQQAGVTEKKDDQRFEFHVAKVPAQSDVTMRVVYYQPLEIDTGIGRYIYPLQEGGTDEVAKSFWVPNSKVEGTFSMKLELKSAWPVAEVRVPGREQAAQVIRVADGHYQVALSQMGGSLNQDVVLYYRLADDLPGRVEVIPYRAPGATEGTFLMVVTPGIDLQPLQKGSDYVFVLDVSGSMQTKIHTLANGVTQTLGQMNDRDRFRIVTFNQQAKELTSGWVNATGPSVKEWVDKIGKIGTDGGTDVHAGLSLALKNLDNDRVTSVILVTDGVTNSGVIDPKAFRTLLEQYDVRVFGFVMGNSANWPLMRVIGEASGGFSSGVSNDDDIVGQILLAKSKIRHESLHHADVEITGGKTHDVTRVPKKIYRGQQVVLLGKYAQPGEATFTLKARLSGQDKEYVTRFVLPEVDQENPELERLWALNRIEEIQAKTNAGLGDPIESATAIRDLGVSYQIVTDETSMLVLGDEAFARRGIDRKNKARVAVEQAAQSVRANAPIRHHRVDTSKPAFPRSAPRLGGGGALDPGSAVIVLLGLGYAIRRRFIGGK
ncbi:MAG: VWA domain-containing protein [Elusimicrobia bacterium]|jgi:Ca-activated chloride channel family protein|nr:VWA domain-containing protein [Elusimicrobiota bacterium]